MQLSHRQIRKRCSGPSKSPKSNIYLKFFSGSSRDRCGRVFCELLLLTSGAVPRAGKDENAPGCGRVCSRVREGCFGWCSLEAELWVGHGGRAWWCWAGKQRKVRRAMSFAKSCSPGKISRLKKVQRPVSPPFAVPGLTGLRRARPLCARSRHLPSVTTFCAPPPSTSPVVYDAWEHLSRTHSLRLCH